MTKIRVINAGLYTTIQDLGRNDFQQFGMPVAGSMDEYAHRIANLLVGNLEDAPVLELTALGGSYEFLENTIIGITGGDMAPVLNETEKIKMWRTVVVKAGDVLSFTSAKNGFRSYLSVVGGFDVPVTMKSCSTYVRGSVGGYEGRPLKRDDILTIKRKDFKAIDLVGRFVRAHRIPSYESCVTLRVILGPQDDAFTPKGIADFFGHEYKVSSDSDRMGYRLEGKKIAHKESADIISDGIMKGAIQVPGHGEPIIMLSDCQTTGGYTKIAYVISSDLWKIAQMKANDLIKFRAIDIDEAHDLFKEHENIFEEIKMDFERYRIEGFQEKVDIFK